jgi:hypothetical protein
MCFAANPNHPCFEPPVRPSFAIFTGQDESSHGAGAVSCQGVSGGPWTASAVKM